MSQPIRHHYLPVFYLHRWTGNDGRMFRYHRPHDRTIVSRRSPEYTGFEEGLYTLDGVADAQIIETNFFSRTDNLAAPVLEHLIARGPGDLDNEQRSSWARLIMSLQLRSPQSVAEVKAVTNRNVREVIERLDGSAYLATKREGDPDSAYEHALRQALQLLANAHKVLLPGLIDHEIIGQVIINMRWAVMNLSAAPHTLLTGDRPYTTSHGLGHPACLLGVPLSPTHLFVAANDMNQLRRLAAQKAKDTVRNANSLIVHLAVQNVYGSTASHLPFVEKRLRRASDPPVPGVITHD